MYVVAGGTFDRLHKGHEFFLYNAFKNGEKVFIGLTTPSMLKKLVRQDSIWPYDKREKVLEEFVKKYDKEFIIKPIKDIFGPTTERKDFDAIVATEETLPTCERINQIRKRKGFKRLKIILVPYVYSEDCRIISSSRIKRREIDREGNVLIDYSITDRLREELRTPINRIFEGDNFIVTKDVISHVKKRNIEQVICVGDEVSRDLLDNDFKPDNIIVDGKVERKSINYLDRILKPYKNRFSLNNPAGRISKEVWKIIGKAFKKESAVFIRGEEDLISIPAILLAKNNSVVIYGQPGRGKVVIRVDDKRKEMCRKRLSEFETIHR